MVCEAGALMSAPKPTDTSLLIQQMTEARTALEKRKADLLASTAAEVAAIDQALGQLPAKPQAKGTKAVRTPGIGEAVLQFVKLRPWSTIREVQAAFPEANPSSVESTVRNLAAGGKLAKDDGNPKRFALPGTKPQGS